MIGKYPVHESRFCWYARTVNPLVGRDRSYNHQQGRFEYACANCGKFEFYPMATWKPGKVCYPCMCKLGLLPPFACKSCDDGDIDDVTLYSKRQPDKRHQSVTPEVRLCAGCDKPLPADSRPNKKTHTAACRQMAKRKAIKIDENEA